LTVCDASVLVALLVPEAQSPSVLKMLQSAAPAFISDFAVGEVYSAIGIKLRTKQISAAQAEAILSDFDLWVGRSAERVVMQHQDMTQAARLVRRFDLGLRMPDALHLALAQRMDAAIATLDRRQSEAARSLDVPVRVFGEI